ncbi:DNA methylase, partial [Desulfobacterales bacterium HSG17]|nr:DNA methylase [Desulfobacterales bacterium HSG17]
LSPIGETLPLNEAQIRPLTNFEPFEQRKIWREFLKSGNDMTAQLIRKFISDYLGKQRPLATPNRIEIISENYRSAVMKMLNQIREAQSDEWQLTSLEAAAYWNNIMKERILWGKK